MTFRFLPHKESMPRQTLPMPHPLALAKIKIRVINAQYSTDDGY